VIEQDFPAVQTPVSEDLPAPTTGRSDGYARPWARARARAVPSWHADRWRAALLRMRMPLAVYGASRVLYLLIALADTAIHKWSFAAEISNWDGVWYTALAGHGYPAQATHLQTTLGFFPLYPMVTWVVSHGLSVSLITGGLIVSLIGGLVSTVLVQRLAAVWWGEAASRRAVLFFCLFPGSIVFSMVYSEGLMLPLVIGCLLALERRRWVLAGLLAAGATAVGPVALAIIPACAVAAWRELSRHGWQDREARRSLLAPLLAPGGVGLFAVYLWIHTGTPFASYEAQHFGWSEKTTPLAIYTQAKHLIHQTLHAPSLHHPGINLNYASGVLGAIFLIAALYLIARPRGRPNISPAAIALTLWTSFLILTSSNTPPNPRMLLCAFPALMVVAYRLRAKAYAWLIGVSTVLLIAMSTVTFVGSGLRP
jgi:hypothetical protein